MQIGGFCGFDLQYIFVQVVRAQDGQKRRTLKIASHEIIVICV